MAIFWPTTRLLAFKVAKCVFRGELKKTRRGLTSFLPRWLKISQLDTSDEDVFVCSVLLAMAGGDSGSSSIERGSGVEPRPGWCPRRLMKH